MSEDILDVLHGIVGVLHHVVQQGCADACGAKSHFGAGDLCHGYGVHDVWFARESSHAFVCLPCKVERPCDDVHLLAVSCGEIVVQQMLESVFHQFVLSCFSGHVGLFFLFHKYMFLRWFVYGVFYLAKLIDRTHLVCFWPPAKGYFTLSFLPARMLLPLMPLSWRSFFTVV